jgi:hypothetical protein
MSASVNKTDEIDQMALKTGPAGIGQRLLWAFERRRSGSGALNVPVVTRLRNDLNKPALEHALNALVVRHEALRTRMKWDPPRLMRVVSAQWEPEFKTVKLSAAADPVAAFEREFRAELTTDIVATEWPLRPTIFTLAPDDHVLCLNLHHIATDSVSNRIILNDLASFYRAACGEFVQPLAEVDWQYSQWIDWQTSQLKGCGPARHIKYWKRNLEGAVGPRFPQSFSRVDLKRFTGHEYGPLGSDVFAGMARLGKQERATLFCVVLAVFYATICRQTAQTDLTVTTLLSERIRPQVLSTVGYFVSAVPLRATFGMSDSFVDLLRTCRTTLFGAIQHQTMPFHVLPRTVTRQADFRIDEVVVQMMGESAEFPEPFEPWYRRPDFGGGRTFDLEVVVQPILGCWSVNVLYGTHQFDKPFIRDLIADFCEVAKLAVADPLVSIRELIKPTRSPTEHFSRV